MFKINTQHIMSCYVEALRYIERKIYERYQSLYGQSWNISPLDFAA